jgi:hypothetical protein
LGADDSELQPPLVAAKARGSYDEKEKSATVAADLFTPPRQPRRPGALHISQELLRKAGERSDSYGANANTTPFSDMQQLLRSQGYR